jgi:hypothetical protein
MPEDSAMANWTREQIIRELLHREASGLSLTAGRKNGVDCALYQAARRIFGSWSYAIAAAGIPVEQATSHDRWSPAKIISNIQSLARRNRPLRPAELRERYGNLSAAARRIFGSWSRAVIAAGVDPAKLRTIPSWTRERVIEEILIRALKNEPLRARSIQPKSLADAGVRLFGNWSGALAAAGIDPGRYACRPTPSPELSVGTSWATRVGVNSTPTTDQIGRVAGFAHRRGQPWTNEAVKYAILVRYHNQRPMNPKAVHREERPLLRAAISRHGSWSNALVVAGLNPAEYQRQSSGHRNSANL